MSGAQRSNGVVGLSGRFLAIALVWLAAVSIATACLFPPPAVFPPATYDDWAHFDNTLVFASSMAMALTFTAATAFAVGGNWRLGLGVLATATILLALAAVSALTSFWLAPGIGRSWMGYWEFLRVQHTLSTLASASARYDLPLGAVVGLAAGTLGGLLGGVARRSRGLAMALVVGLLLASSIGPVQRFAFGTVLHVGIVVRSRIMSPGMTDPVMPASGAVAGAFAGTLVAAAAMWRSWTRPAADRA